jgi:hypothetical protein
MSEICIETYSFLKCDSLYILEIKGCTEMIPIVNNSMYVLISSNCLMYIHVYLHSYLTL